MYCTRTATPLCQSIRVRHSNCGSTCTVHVLPHSPLPPIRVRHSNCGSTCTVHVLPHSPLPPLCHSIHVRHSNCGNTTFYFIVFWTGNCPWPSPVCCYHRTGVNGCRYDGVRLFPESFLSQIVSGREEFYLLFSLRFISLTFCSLFRTSRSAISGSLTLLELSVMHS